MIDSFNIEQYIYPAGKMILIKIKANIYGWCSSTVLNNEWYIQAY